MCLWFDKSCDNVFITTLHGLNSIYHLWLRSTDFTKAKLSVAPTRHWVTCSSNPGVGGIFFLTLAPFLLYLSIYKSLSLSPYHLQGTWMCRL